MAADSIIRNRLLRLVNRQTPASDYVFDVLRPLMEDRLPQAYRHADCFDRFEYLMALVFVES
jgi:hypothetical protein